MGKLFKNYKDSFTIPQTPGINKYAPDNTKRTLKTTPAAGLPPLYLTPTEVGATANTQKMQNEPNLPSQRTCGGPKMQNEPNLPLPQPGPRSKNAKRTQSPVRPRHAMPHLCETNPIYRATAILPARPCPQYAKRTQITVQMASQRHFYAKRTQFSTINIHSTIYNIQSRGPIYNLAFFTGYGIML